jgi:KAP family P-loop domain
MVQSSGSYYADSPVEKIEDDIFDRSSFSARMASVVDQMGSESSSSVAALVGPWGSGKSSVLNLFTAQIQKDSSRWQVRRFNPWLFTDVNSLLASYFSELLAAMPDTPTRERVRERLSGYAKRIAPLGKLSSLIGLDTSGAMEAIGDLLLPSKSLTDQRDELVEALQAVDSRVLIVLDDVDRLQPDELLLVLKLIRLIGDLPNVHYLLAYDERTLLDVLMGTPLASTNESRAAQYVDKMVQVRFDLPPLTDIQTERAFRQGFLRLLDSIGESISDQEFRRLGEFYQETMHETLRIPRRMKKYLAQLSAFLTSGIAGELNVVDFTILTYIRTFHGTLYARLPQWKSHLTGSGLTALEWARGRDTPEKKREGWEVRLRMAGTSSEDMPSTLELLGALFPTLQQLLDGVRVGGIDANTAAHRKHLASAEYFDRYFQFAVPEDDVSDALVLDALSHLLDGAEAADSTTTLLSRLNADPGLVLGRIRLLIVQRQCRAPQAMLQALSDRYSSLDWRDRQALLVSPKDQARYLAHDILDRLPEESQETQAVAIAESVDLRFSLDLAFTILRGEHNQHEWVESYRDALNTRFSALLEDVFANLDEVDYDTFSLFTTWGQIAGDGVARSFAQAKIESDTWDIDRCLAYLTGTSYLIGVSNPMPRLSGLEADWIELLLGVDFAISKIGSRLNETQGAPHLYETANPTYEQRREYALGVLKDLRERRNS